jgi:opacity protein-like surface antigen
MKIQTTAIILSLCFCAFLSQAQDYWYLPPGAGPYFRMGVGPTIYQDGTLKGYTLQGNPAFSAQNQKVSYDVGVVADGALGWSFNQYVGLDFESGYMWGRINNIPGYNANGSTIANVPLLGNLTLSLPIPHTNIVPYIGGGAGGAVSTFDAHGFSDSGGVQTAYGSESDTVFAYQAFAGVRFMLSPNVSVGLGYKYFATGNPTFSYPPGPNLNVAFSGVHTHSILFTLQCNF